MSMGKYASNLRPAVIGIVILYSMYSVGLFAGSTSQVALNGLIWLLYICILFIPKSKWDPKHAWVAFGLLLGITGVNLYWYHDRELVYFFIFIAFYALLRLILPKPLWPALLTLLITAVLFIRFGALNLTGIVTYISLAIVLYSVIRRRMMRKEMHEQNLRHLAELRKAYDELQEASAMSMRFAVLEERTRIARDIHDSVGHSFTSLIVQLQALRYMVRQDPGLTEHTIDEMLAVARQGLQDIRNSVHELADDPSISGKAALNALLSRMEASTGIRYVVHDELPDGELGDGIYGILFKILQEAITNVVRHAQATEVEVNLRRDNRNIVMNIRDNGKLQAGQAISEGFGLKTMRTRVEEKGGSLQFMARELNGLEIVTKLPESLGQLDRSISKTEDKEGSRARVEPN